MKRILTGIQSSGNPHLGNVLGAIKPALELANRDQYEAFFFIADLHSLTSIKEAKFRKDAVLATAAAWLACGLDPEKHIFYRQSKVNEVCELNWYLSCLTPYPMLLNAHSFKDKKEKLSDINAGLFTYPVLMASDILLYDANEVPVGKDQKQHLEMTKDIAQSFNHHFGKIFVIPEALTEENTKIVPGRDGHKMSKSYQNTIDIFSSDKALRKQIMSIKTDSLTIESPKDPKTCTVFKLYRLLADSKSIEDIKKKYLKGNYGYGEAKQALFNLILVKFKKERKIFNFYLNNPEKLEIILQNGERKAQIIARNKLQQIRKVLGYE